MMRGSIYICDVAAVVAAFYYNDLRFFLKNTVGRHELMDSKSSITAPVNSTTSDKVNGTSCYCCPNDSQKEYCHKTMRECSAGPTSGGPRNLRFGIQNIKACQKKLHPKT
jgi:hypothetical protein